MKLWIMLFLSTLLFGRSIPEGYISPIPADVLTKPDVHVHFGELHFDDGTLLPESKQKIEDELAYMQLSGLYFKNHEAVWLELLREELQRLSITPNKTLAITASPITSKVLWPRLDPGMVYTVALLDTRQTPVILQLPGSFSSARILDHYGNTLAVLDANSSYLLYGPDEKFVPATQLKRVGENDTELQGIQSDTYISFLFIQMPRENDLATFESQLKIMPLEGDQSEQNSFVDIASAQSIALLPKSARFFKLLDTIAQYDALPAHKANELATAGITKGKLFQPDMHKRALLQDAAHTAGIILQNTPALNKLQALSEKVENIRLEVDDTNTTLDGAKHYVLHIPSVPAKSWSVTLYDTQTASMLQNPLQLRPYILSSNEDLHYNDDGSIDIHFAPNMEDEALEANTIKTVAGKKFFAIVRFYSPKQECCSEETGLQIKEFDENAPKEEPNEDIGIF